MSIVDIWWAVYNETIEKIEGGGITMKKFVISFVLCLVVFAVPVGSVLIEVAPFDFGKYVDE